MSPAALLVLVLLGSYQPSTLVYPPAYHSGGFHRASRFYLQLYSSGTVNFNNPQGLAVTKLTAEDDPTTMRDDAIVTLFGVNSGAGQIVYNVGLKRMATYGRVGSDTGQFRAPHGIAADPSGAVYVADTGNDRIVALRYDAGALVWAGTIGGLRAPQGVALDSQGRVYVTDTGNNRILVYGPDRQLRRTISLDLAGPTAIAVLDKDAPRNYFHEEMIVVVDRDGTRLSRLSLAGQPQATTSLRAIGLVDGSFGYCALDFFANVYVTDPVNNQIHKFDRNLNYLISIGREGTGDYEFQAPRGIAIARRYGQVFLAEAESGQYYWIGVDGYITGCYPSRFSPRAPGTTIALYLTEAARVELTVLDESGRVVRRLATGPSQPAGEDLIVWDDRDDAGRLVPPGRYTVHARIRATYSSARDFSKELTASVQCIEDT